MTPEPQAGPPPADPVLTADEREALWGLSFLAAEVDKFAARGLISDDSRATIQAETAQKRESIERLGRARGDVEVAKRRQGDDPALALFRLDRARGAAPDWAEPWLLAVKLLERTGRIDEAVALCEQAAARFDTFPIHPSALRARDMASRAAAEPALEGPLKVAREALRLGRDREVVGLCDERLAVRPDDLDAVVLLAFARQRLGDLDEALGLYQRLATLQPDNPTWRQWVTTVEARRRAGVTPSTTKMAKGPEPEVAQALPGLSWRAAAGEFLEDHWQKLILCLAVLLIVVSSNIGAYQVLGPKIWSPAGKCVLALVYTALFAGLGIGLIRWGAGRAGGILLLTTLVMVPANFLLVGEMKLLTEPTAAGLAVLAVDSLALLALVRLVGHALALKHGAGVLTALLFTLSACNAAAPPAPVWPWGWHFAFFLAPAFVFLGAVVWLLTAFQRGTGGKEGRGEVTDGALGLLAFVFVTGAARVGGFTLGLPPTLYALPVMLTAVACVFAAARRSAYDPDPRHAAWLKFGGLVLSGLGFTLALARPPGPSAVSSGNTLATALAGLGLYAILLRKERKPAYLYFAFGALFLAYFGASYFTTGAVVRAVERAASRALGFGGRLPLPFKAVNGLVFNVALGALAVWFKRAWDDPRLARHCHYIGVPFSVAAGAISLFEPTAGLVCLSGYAFLYALASRVFADPRLYYGVTAAVAGAAFSGTALVSGMTGAGQALVGSAVALGYWLASAGLARVGGGDGARLALGRSALALVGLSSLGALISVWPAGGASWLAAGALGLAAVVVALENLAARSSLLAYGASALAGLAYFLAVARGAGLAFDWRVFPTYALAAGGGALALAVLGDWGRRRVAEGAAPAWLVPYPLPWLQGAFLQVGLALLACGAAAGRNLAGGSITNATTAAALGLAAAAVVVLTRPYPSVALAHLATACGLGGWVAGATTLVGVPPSGLALYGAEVASYAVALVALEELAGTLARRFGPAGGGAAPSSWLPTADLFAGALPPFEVAAVLGATALAASGLAGGLPLAWTLAGGATALFWSTRFRPHAGVVGLALAHAAAAALALTAWRVGWADHGFTLGCLALTAAGAALLSLTLGRAMRDRALGAAYARPCFDAATLLTSGAFGLALAARFESPRAFPIVEAALLADAAALLWMTALSSRPSLTYRALLAVVLAAYVAVFSLGKPRPDSGYVLGLVAVVLALGFSAAGFACRRWRGETAERLYTGPLFRTAMGLTALAVLPAYQAPGTMALVALSFLLFVKGLPGRAWIYPAVAALACSIYHAFLTGYPASRWVAIAMGGAYGLWLAGMLVRRAEPALRAWLGLPSTGYDTPVFDSAVAFALLAVALRGHEAWGGAAVGWSGLAGFTLNLSAFCLLMVKPRPGTVWLNLAVGLASASAALGLQSQAGHLPLGGADWLLLGLTLAHVWGVVGRGSARFDGPLRRRLGLEGVHAAASLKTWSLGFFVASTAVAWAFVGLGVAAAATGGAPVAALPRDWWALLAALALGAAYLPPAFWAESRAGVIGGAWGFLLAAVWFGVGASSPLYPNYLGDAHDSVALATALFALLTALGGHWRVLAGDGLAGPYSGFAARAGGSLAVVAGLLTLGWDRPSTLVTLLLAAVALGDLAVGRRWVAAGYAAGLALLASAVSEAFLVFHAWGVTPGPDRGAYLAAALLGAAGTLWALAAAPRGSWLSVPEGRERPLDLPARSVSLAFEQMALAGAAAAAFFLVSALWDRPPTAAGALAAVGAHLGLALLLAGLVARWGEEWLVYPAQAALVGSYLYYRRAFPLPEAADALVLTLFGYVDFGLAEAMARAGLEKLARPTRYVALALPVLPLALEGAAARRAARGCFWSSGRGRSTR